MRRFCGLSFEGSCGGTSGEKGLENTRFRCEKGQRSQRYRSDVSSGGASRRRDDFRGRIRARAVVLRHGHGNPHRGEQMPSHSCGRGGKRSCGEAGDHGQRRKRACHGRILCSPATGCDIADAYLNAELGCDQVWWHNFYEFHKLAIDELEAFDYEEYKKNGFKVHKLGDYPLKLEVKPE